MAETEINYFLLAMVIFVAIGTVPFLLAFKTVPEDQRYIIERMGRFARVCGPGKHFIAPYIDRAIVIDLESELPGWRRMSAREIETKLTLKRYGG